MTGRPTEPEAQEGETFTVILRGEPGADAVLGIRALLKAALRRWGLRCVSIRRGHDDA